MGTAVQLEAVVRQKCKVGDLIVIKGFYANVPTELAARLCDFDNTNPR